MIPFFFKKRQSWIYLHFIFKKSDKHNKAINVNWHTEFKHSKTDDPFQNAAPSPTDVSQTALPVRARSSNRPRDDIHEEADWRGPLCTYSSAVVMVLMSISMLRAQFSTSPISFSEWEWKPISITCPYVRESTMIYYEEVKSWAVETILISHFWCESHGAWVFAIHWLSHVQSL